MSGGVEPVVMRALVALMAALVAAPAGAHSGPPFPIVSNQVTGPYKISIWTDPDATDDGSAQGKFWVTLEPARGNDAVPSGTRAHLTIRARDREGAAQAGTAEPVENDPRQHYVALLMDHEGPYGIHLVVDGGLGPVEVDSQVDATYDLRPPPATLIVYTIPFLLVGLLWGKLLLRRRRAQGRPVPAQP